MHKLYFLFIFLSIMAGRSLGLAQGIALTDFNPKVDLATGKYPVGVAVADLDKDGKPDIIVANEGANTVSVFRNISSGATLTAASFTTKVDIALTGVNPESLVISDIDGDGWLDIVVSNSNGKTISVLRSTSSTGNISFAPKVDITVGYYAHALCIGNIDGDTKPDIAVANFDAGVITLFENTSSSGSISFGTGVDVVTGGNPTAVSIGDLDGDSHPDLAVVIHDRGVVSVFRNTNDSINTNGFSQRFDFSVGGSPYALQMADLDLDGHTDLIVSNIDKNNTVSVLRNTTSGSTINFSAKVDFITGTHPYSICIKDIDGNGKPDILSGNWYNTGTASVLQNVSTSGSIAASSFLPRVDLPSGTNPESVASADLNADGEPDLVVANSFDGTISILQYYPIGAPHPALPESTASVSNSSFVSTDLMDNEWKQEAPPGYVIAGDDGTTINAGLNAGNNAGRFVYLWSMGSRTPLMRVQGNLTFTAKGSGTVTVKIMASSNLAVQASQTFTLTGSYTDFNWALSGLYPQTEYIVGVIFKGASGTPQVSGQFKKNFCLNLRQAGMSGAFTRFRADSTSLIGNTEKGWYGWSDTANAPRKKYLQHSAFARMRFQTTATNIAVEYVRDFYDKRVVNLFNLEQTMDGTKIEPNGTIDSGYYAVNNFTKVDGGHTYTISGLLTTNPVYCWYSNGVPIGGQQDMVNQGTSAAPVYQLTAPASATNLGIQVQTFGNTYLVYTQCMIQEGTIGTVTPLDGTIPSPYVAFTGYVPSYISGPAIFINGNLYKYYQVEGGDLAKVPQFVTDTLPAGNKTVEVMMPGQGIYLTSDPHIRRGGTYLRAVYFPGSATMVAPATAAATGSILFIHDSILSGFNISSDAQNNVWMMKIKRDPAFGFAGDVLSEGYASRILYTDISTPALTTAFAAKLAAYGVDKFWFQVGVNDYGFITPLKSFYTQYKSLIEQLKVLRPNAKMYIQCIGPALFDGPNAETYADDGLTSTGPTAGDFRDVQRAIANTHAYCEYVNFEGLFPATTVNLSDGIHPTDAGNQAYANGIKSKSTLLGTVMPDSALAFLRRTTRHMTQTLPGVYTITAKNGKLPYTFTLTSGSLPAGLTFNGDGTITGIPTVNGLFPLTVKVTDGNNNIATATDTLVINPVPAIRITPSSITANINHPDSATFVPSNGFWPYTIAYVSGSLPPGMSFNASTRKISGTPTGAGTFRFLLSATDKYSFSTNDTITVQVNLPPPPPGPDTLTVNASVDATTGHLIIANYLQRSLSESVYANIDAFVTQGSNPERMVSNNNVVVGSGNVSSGGTDFGLLNLDPGAFALRLHRYAPQPASVGGNAIVADTSAVFHLTMPSPTTSEAFSLTAMVGSNGHLMVTGHLPNAHSADEYAYAFATYYQNGISYYMGTNPSSDVVVNHGNTSSQTYDFGVMSSLVSGPYSVTLHLNYGIDPTISDFTNITYSQSTSFSFVY